jgi:prefoldin alpha subunit
MNEDKLKETYLSLTMVEQEMKTLTEQVQELNSKLMELEYIKISLDEFSGLSEGQEILAPFTNGIFLKAKLQSATELVVNVGAGAAVTKDVAGTKVLIDKQVTEISQMREQLVGQLQILAGKSNSLEQELRTLMKEGGNV